MRNSNCCSYRR